MLRACRVQGSHRQGILVSNEFHLKNVENKSNTDPNSTKTVPVSSWLEGERPSVLKQSSGSVASTVGGEDGPADVAVGGHGCQFPPGVNKRENQQQNLQSAGVSFPHCDQSKSIAGIIVFLIVFSDSYKIFFLILKQNAKNCCIANQGIAWHLLSAWAPPCTQCRATMWTSTRGGCNTRTGSRGWQQALVLTWWQVRGWAPDCYHWLWFHTHSLSIALFVFFFSVECVCV